MNKLWDGRNPIVNMRGFDTVGQGVEPRRMLRPGTHQGRLARPNLLVTPFIFMNIVAKLVSTLFFYKIVAKHVCSIFLHFVFNKIVAYTFILTSFFLLPFASLVIL